MTYPQGYMNPKLFTKIVDQLPRETVIVPFFRGESLLHPHFNEFMYELGGFKEVQLASNGDLLTESKEQSIKYFCTFISLSLHEFKLPIDTESIAFFKDARSRLTTQVSILNNLILQDQKKLFIDEWLQYVNRVRIYIEHSQRGCGDTNLNIQDDGQGCHKPFSDLMVYWDGKVGLCNHDWNNQTFLGDLNKHSIKEIWNDIGYNYVRKLHLEGKRREVSVCKDCDFWVTEYLPNKMLGELYE